jgi:hypothetical protein
MVKPELTKRRIVIAYLIAVVADLLEFPISAAEVTVVVAPAAEGVDVVVDAIVFVIMTKLLGFHWMLLPSAFVEAVPGLDVLPTWAGCVFFVVRQRRKELNPEPLPKAIKEENVIDV